MRADVQAAAFFMQPLMTWGSGRAVTIPAVWSLTSVAFFLGEERYRMRTVFSTEEVLMKQRSLACVFLMRRRRDILCIEFRDKALGMSVVLADKLCTKCFDLDKGHPSESVK